MIDVKDMMARVSIDDLNAKADEYFRDIWKMAALSKPFIDLGEAPEVIATFFHVLKGLGVFKGARVLDFGAGTCWSTRLLACFGYRAVAVDISPAALDIGRELFQTHKVLIDHPEPEFLRYDGYKLPLEDESVDAIMCLSAYHHLPNPDTLLEEFYRVLKPNGVLGCSEPGPNHSRTPQSQHEMRQFGVIENDIVIEDIWAKASDIGFSNVFLSVFYPEAYVTTLTQYSAFLGGQRLDGFDASVRALMQERRLFFLEKGVRGLLDSSQPAGLESSLQVQAADLRPKLGKPFTVVFEAKNVGTTVWRPSDSLVGPVRVGVQVARGDEDFRDAARFPLPATPNRFVCPGDTVRGEFSLVLPAVAGPYRVKVDLVAEAVKWFDAAHVIDVFVV